MEACFDVRLGDDGDELFELDEMRFKFFWWCK